MEAKFSQRVKDVISYSREEALRLQSESIGVEHLLLGIIREGEGLAVKILHYLGVDLQEVRKTIEQSLKLSSGNSRNIENIPLVKQAERILKITYLEAKLFKSDLIGTEHLLLSILKDDNNIATQVLNKQGVFYDDVKKELLSILNENPLSPDMGSIKGDLPQNNTGSDDEEDMEEIGRAHV